MRRDARPAAVRSEKRNRNVPPADLARLVALSGSSQDKARTLRGDVLDGVPQVVQAPQQGGLRGLRELAARDALLQGLGLRGRGRRAAGRGDARARLESASGGSAVRPPGTERSRARVRDGVGTRAALDARGNGRRPARRVTSWRRLCSRRGNTRAAWCGQWPTLESRHVNTSEPRESALLEIRDPNARKSDFHPRRMALESRAARGTARVVAFVLPKRTSDATPGDARGSPTRRDTVASGSIAVSRFSHGARLGRDRQSGGGERGSPPGRRRKRFIHFVPAEAD